MSAPILKTNATPYGVSSPLTYTKGIVVSVDLGNQVAEVQFPDHRDKVSITPLRGKSGYPAVGETWVLDQTYGSWMFAVLLDPPRPPAWIAAPLLGSFTVPTGFPAPAYLKDSAGMVRLRGTVSGGSTSQVRTTGQISADMLQLPAGYRPGLILGPLALAANHAYGEVSVLTNGLLRANTGTAPFCLDGIAFLAEQ